jgi:hypothetical protein
MACLCACLILPLAVETAFSATVKPALKARMTAMADDAAKRAPRAFFPELRYAFEPVLEGEKIKHDFIVENQGNAPLVIKNIRPD